MDMNSVERLAVNKVSDTISHCPHLEHYFDVNDKTPLTDGHIDIHSSVEMHTKENFRGRVPVQIKGRRVDKKLNAFPISRIELKGYLRDSGVLYLVVSIDKKTGHRRVTYALLNPFKIKRILQAMRPGQKKVSVNLKKLPRDPGQIEALLTLAYQTRRESPDTGFDPVLAERIKEFTVHTDRGLDMEAPIHLAGADLDYSLVIETDSGMSVPVDWEVSITPASYVGRTTDWVVCSGGHCFYNPYWKRIDKDSVELQLSEGLKLRFIDHGEYRSGSISLTLRDSLAGRLGDLSFLFGCMDDSGFTFNDREVGHHVDGLEDEGGLRAHLVYLKRLNELLTKLDVDVTIVSVAEITSKQSDQLRALHAVIVQGKEFADENIEHSGRILQRLGSWNIELLCLDGSQEGKWRCLDLFDPNIGQHFAMSAETEADKYDSYLVTPYEIIDDNNLTSTLNLHLPEIVAAYESLPSTPRTFSLANHMVLKLITAGDLSEPRRNGFREAAETLNEWLILEEGEEPHHLINRWQIIARTAALSVQERQLIRTLKRAAGGDAVVSSPQIEASCAILLEDVEEIEFCLQRLDDSDLEEFQRWPIWSLYKSRI